MTDFGRVSSSLEEIRRRAYEIAWPNGEPQHVVYLPEGTPTEASFFATFGPREVLNAPIFCEIENSLAAQQMMLTRGRTDLFRPFVTHDEFPKVFPNSDFGRLTELILLHEWYTRIQRREEIRAIEECARPLWELITEEEKDRLRDLAAELKETR